MKYDLTIIGGGIVGLSTAYKILDENPKLKVALIEKESSIGKHQTGHNSGVIHSGIYYKPNSLKANNCRRGIKLLLKFCKKYDIEYDICGKIILASKKDQINNLKALLDRGINNGIKGLKLIEKDEIREYENYASGELALLCPETGIIDYSLVSKMLYKIIKNKANIFLKSEVLNIAQKSSELIIETEKSKYKSSFLINCSGLYSDKIAEKSGLTRRARIIPFRGEYYKLKGDAKKLVNNLIYPVPNPNYPFLGVHFTRTINGEVEAGPNAVLAWSREGYKKRNIKFDEIWDYISYKGFWKMSKRYWKTGLEEYHRSFSKKAFLKSLQKLIPSISIEDIEKSPSGVRAQALGVNGVLVDDFLIDHSPYMIHIINAPSPAATSSFAIGETISKIYYSYVS